MWIRRLAVENWRGLDCELDALTPGLNLIAGPNESGKSRLVEALRFALFESSSGQAAHKKNLQTWGVAPEKPRVTVEFELEGTSWRLEKVFLGTGCNTLLRGGDVELAGEAAEQRLCDLLGVAGGSGRTEARPRDQGIWSLLWVDQGESQFEPVHNPDAQNRILTLLTDEIGEVAAGESGKRLLALAEAERGRYYTPRSGAERDAITRPRQAVAELEARLADAVARREARARAADELDELRHKLVALETRDREAGSRLEDVAARQREAESLRGELNMAEERVEASARARQDAERQLERLARAQAEHIALADAVAASEHALDHTQAECTQAQQDFESVSEAHRTLGQRIDELESTLRALRRQQRLTSQRRELERAATRLEEAGSLVEQEAALRAELASLPRVGSDDVARLRKAIDERSDARARLQGAAVSVEIRALDELDLPGGPLAPGETRRFSIDDDRELRLGHHATVTVRPGGGEILRLRDKAADADRRVTGMLEALGVTNAETAETVVHERARLTGELERSRDALARHVPEGVPALEQAVAELRAAVAAAAGPPDAGPCDPEALERAEAELQALTEAAARAQARRETAQARLSEARVAHATVSSRLESERSQLSLAARRLAEQPAEDVLRATLDEADRALEKNVAAREQTRQRFDACGGESLAEELERAEKAAQQLRQLAREAREESIRLEATLQAASGDARHELVLDLEAELATAREELSRVTRQAAAAWRLHEVLDREYRAARERLTAPVIERIRPYLNTLFPGAEVWLDEELNLKGLRTDTAHESFASLSGGAREQLSLLVRIGLAEVVGRDEPWPLVLDDVLVNTDASRIRRMQGALYGAGRRMQILLFTCHGALFDALGPDAYIELPAPPRRDAGAPPPANGARPDPAT